MPLQLRRGTSAEKNLLSVPLAEGEPLWVTDTGQLYIGDGVTLASVLDPIVGFGEEEAQDAAANLFSAGSHTDITFTYNDSSGSLDAAVSISALRENVDMGGFSLTGSGDITTTGTVTATSIVSDSLSGNYTGSVFADDSTLLVNAVDASINLDGTVKGNIIPDANEAYDLGSMGARFKDLYLSGSSLFLGTAVITANANNGVDLPGNSTINGEPLGAATFAGTNLNVNIIGDDSGVIVDSATNNIVASTVTADAFIGDIQGSLFGNDSTTLVNGIASQIEARRFYNTDEFNFRNDTNRVDITLQRRDGFTSDRTSGSINFTATPDSGLTIEEYGRIVGGPLGFFFVNDPTGASNFPASSTVTFTADGIGFGTYTPSAALDIKGAGIITGGLTADVTGSLFSDSSTMLIDGTDGKLMAANIDVIGETGNAPVDTGSVDSWLEISVNGATKYIPLYD